MVVLIMIDYYSFRTCKRKKENLKPLTEDVFRQVTEWRDRGVTIRDIGRTLGYDESTIFRSGLILVADQEKQ